jgi:polyferredoxin
LFPVVLYYLSPYVIIDGSSQGIVTGSFILFALLFLSALFLGRAWCGWACPAAGLQEACFAVSDKPARGGRLDWIKWFIWVPWIGVIVAMAVMAGGYFQIDPLYLTDRGISVVEVHAYIIYYVVVGTIFLLSLTAGRRAFCHYGCWMAPFLIIGRRLRNLFKWPSFRLKAEPDKCLAGCQLCNKRCPMSLDVKGLVQVGRMEHNECILCGTCVDVCPKEVLCYSFSRGE